MKNIFSICLFLLSVSLFAQQNKFLEIVQEDKDLRAPVFFHKLSEIFAQPESWTAITILADELANAPSYDFSKLVNLDLVQVQFSFSPDSSDAAKKAYVEKIKKLMANMVYFAKCPKLKNVIFGIGEQIYLTKEQCKPVGKEVKNSHKLNKRRSVENLKYAWESFGKDVGELLPNVSIYGYTWLW